VAKVDVPIIGARDWASAPDAHRAVCRRVPGDMVKALSFRKGAATDSIVVAVHGLEE